MVLRPQASKWDCSSNFEFRCPPRLVKCRMVFLWISRSSKWQLWDDDLISKRYDGEYQSMESNRLNVTLVFGYVGEFVSVLVLSVLSLFIFGWCCWWEDYFHGASYSMWLVTLFLGDVVPIAWPDMDNRDMPVQYWRSGSLLLRETSRKNISC